MALYYGLSSFFDEVLYQSLISGLVEAEHMIIPVVIHTDNPVPRQQTASSIAVTSTSHDSGFAGRNRSSGETARTSEPGSLGDVDGSTGWNGCPTGCGCRCSMGGPTRRQSG